MSTISTAISKHKLTLNEVNVLKWKKKDTLEAIQNQKSPVKLKNTASVQNMEDKMWL